MFGIVVDCLGGAWDMCSVCVSSSSRADLAIPKAMPTGIIRRLITSVANDGDGWIKNVSNTCGQQHCAEVGAWVEVFGRLVRYEIFTHVLFNCPIISSTK